MNTDILKAIDNLLAIIQEYHLDDVRVQAVELNRLKNYLMNAGDLANRDKLTIYQSLFPPRGGLSDINYWNNDFELRKSVNERIAIATTTIADFLLDRVE